MKASYAVSYAPQALEDLKDIYAYIAFTLQAVSTAKNQVNQIRKEIRALDAMPLRYPVVDWEPWRSLRMRKMPVGHFIVFYTADTEMNAVTVIRIVYGGRNLEALAQEVKP